MFSCVGGRIDHAHHYNNPYRALDETLELETALLAALERVNPAETLIVVTADHGHVMTFGGQATPRGHPVLGNKTQTNSILTRISVSYSHYDLYFRSQIVYRSHQHLAQFTKLVN